ncbi:MAG TPA: phosphatidylserine decarboxylase family protein [Candidatus Eisenbacteria bacterium]|nr:phosphatidylserine decarboxylase family protein [Candidatus Eisenbacteria bacterium]
MSQFSENTRETGWSSVRPRIKIAREGYPLIVASAMLAAGMFVAGWNGPAGLFTLLTLGFAGFFRDPDRHPPRQSGVVLAPADGKVVSIVPVTGDPFVPDAVVRLSIFLSPLDVHINRTPVEGRVEEVRYQHGRFLAAYRDRASRENEQNALRIADRDGRKVGVVQVAGVLARRIVCRVKAGDSLERGERFGLIMFGSRTDLYLPPGCEIAVTEGERVKGGETIVARFL